MGCQKEKKETWQHATKIITLHGAAWCFPPPSVTYPGCKLSFLIPFNFFNKNYRMNQSKCTMCHFGFFKWSMELVKFAPYVVDWCLPAWQKVG